MARTMTQLPLLLALVVAQAVPQASAPAAPQGLDARRKQLVDLLDEHWEYTMRTNPEYASLLGDKRYHDKLTDFSDKPVMAQIEMNLRGTPFKDWEMPVSQFSGIHINAPQLVSVLSFETVKDYDDYVARLRQLPTAFAQTTELMRKGVQDRLVPPRILLEQVARQSAKIADVEPEANPFFEPAGKIPASFPEADKVRIREQMLAAVR